MASAKLIQELVKKLTGGVDTTTPVPPKGSVGLGPDITDVYQGRDVIDMLELDKSRAALEEASSETMQPSKMRATTVNEGFDPGGPNVFGEKQAGPVTSGIDPDAPKNKIHKQSIQAEELSLDDPRAQETMLDLFGDEQDKIVKDIQDIINHPNNPQLSPNLERETARGMVQDRLTAKRVDETAKKVFNLIEDLESSLVVPKEVTDQSVLKQLHESTTRLRNFKREAAQTAQEARDTNNPELLEAIYDRLTAPPKGR